MKQEEPSGSKGWYGEDRIRGAVEEETAAAIQPPPQKKLKPGQKVHHCRFFNFGYSTCYLPFCKFAHVDDWNHDYRANKTLVRGDDGYVTEEILSTLKVVHENAKKKLHDGKGKKETVVIEAEEPEAPTEEKPDICETESLAQHELWLDSARSEPLQMDSVFNRDRVNLTFHGYETKVRFPYEAAKWMTEKGDQVSLTVHRKTHATWSCMLYGNGKGVMSHLQSCLLLGYNLRYKLKPLLLQQYNIEFENILYVTTAALDECAFRACSMVWSMVLKDIPTVHEDRLAGTSKHLIGEGTHPSHLFLKVEAFKSTAGLSIISDLDLVITSLPKLAKHINRFHKHRKEDAEIWRPGTVMVMQRNMSRVVDEDPVRINVNHWSPHHVEQGQMPVSYCFAFISPTPELLEKYLEAMQSPPPRQDLLSDQHLLSQLISEDFTMAMHNIVAFTSWWVHSDICEKRAQEVMELNMDGDYAMKPWPDHGKDFLEMIGAFHLSQSFNFTTCAESLESKKAGWVKSMRMKPHPLKRRKVWPNTYRKETFHDYIEVLASLWVGLRDKHQNQLTELTNVMVNSVDELTPGLGIMKGLMALLKKPETSRTI